MVQTNTRFKVCRGPEEKLPVLSPENNGLVYFTTDTDKIFLFTESRRILISGGGGGGGGATVLYANAPAFLEENDKGFYEIPFDKIDNNPADGKANGLIINFDGSFYRIIEVDEASEVFNCKKILVAGNGGGSVESKEKSIRVTADNLAGTTVILNGQDAWVRIQAFSAIKPDGTIRDEKGQMNIIVVYEEKVNGVWQKYRQETLPDALDHEGTVDFNYGKYAKYSTVSRLVVYAEGANSGMSDPTYMGASFTTGILSLDLTETCKSEIKEHFDSDKVVISCNALGDMDRRVELWWGKTENDLVKIDERDFSIRVAGDTGRDTVFNLNTLIGEEIAHGYYTVQLKLYQMVNGEKRLSTDDITFEIAVVEANNKEPIVWFDYFKKEYYNYEDIVIPFHVFNPFPVNNETEVQIYRNNVKIGTRSFEGKEVFSKYEIVDADDSGAFNYYGIGCGETVRDVVFSIVVDTSRADMKLQKSTYLDILFDARGNSNEDSAVKRESWGYTKDSEFVKANFKDFNWYNNGWKSTADGTCLTISNGASFEVPVDEMIFSGTGAGRQSHTFEFQFKIRNVQSYQNLISNITRYAGDEVYYNQFYGYVQFERDDGSGYSDTKVYFLKDENDNYTKVSIATKEDYDSYEELYIGTVEGFKTKYTNYDAFLQNYAATHDLEYDDITKDFDHIQRIFNLDALVCGFYSGSSKSPIGIGLGPQDAFFSNGPNTVSTSYIEDKMINLSIVYDADNKLMSMYINGILSGAIYSTLTGSFKIASNKIVFNSNYCDIDLYKFRVYRTALSMNEIGTNYAFDFKDVIMYDQNNLVNASNKNLFDFNQMIAYNEAHPDDPIMPYIIFDTTNSGTDNRLSWSKAKKVTIGVEFVNTGLDRAYASGELDALAAKDGVSVADYYAHHCPSWIGEFIEMAVQGTSSEFYPRRNYKLKTKTAEVAGGKKKVHMTMHRGPFALENKHTDWFYMDNYSVGTTKFTMKIDFMESSGSYNRGLANLVHNAHSHHPLYYYNKAGAVDGLSNDYINDLRTNVQGYPVLAFHKYPDGKNADGSVNYKYVYIGRYNMLTDKGSDETFGFAAKNVTMPLVGDKDIKTVAECWEFENNSRGFCSFRDPLHRKFLSFNIHDQGNEGNLDTKTSTAPKVVEDFEYRYHSKADSIDVLLETRMDSFSEKQKSGLLDDLGVEINSPDSGQRAVLDLYGNWEKAVQWVWSTCRDESFVKTQAEIDAMSAEERTQYLIEEFFKVSSGATYDEEKKYYIYDKHLYTPYEYSEDTWNDVISKLYSLEAVTKTYDNILYRYDTKEYREAKFKAELGQHFNIDYLATYFVVTEALELYDSRGKNCMMASWGPLKEGGDYIWFPIFYDMDTQLGINNTGIPSFEFSIDATEEGTFSTNDSVLWNNFYDLFQNQILQKYLQLKGNTNKLGDFEALGPSAPFTSPEKIEGWYESDPEYCDSFSMRGQRPLSAINLDEWYKYIAITDVKGGGYLGQSGQIVYDNKNNSTGDGAPSGSYFYALQGNRALSRLQFLKNRFNYLDSWLGVGIYSKEEGKENCFWGRLTANNIAGDKSSDHWVATPEEPYFLEDGVTKRHEFDSEYWMTLTPSRKSYLKIIADDSEFVGKYTNNPVKIEIEKVKNAIQTSLNYDEQLIYIYGTETMTSFGDLYKLYLTELHTIESKNLVDLTLGWDGVDQNGNPWYNYNTNSYELSRMPLLKSANLCNITYSDKASSKVIDLRGSEKLQNFRATGSNFEQIQFADGVALDTLYLPNTISTLELTEARRLKNVLTEKPRVAPDENDSTKLVADKGLYIEGFTDKLDTPNAISTQLTILSILNANSLGYGAYKLLHGYYLNKNNEQNIHKIAMTNVDWSPYKLVTKDERYLASAQYFEDNNHYQFVPSSYNPAMDDNNKSLWNALIANGKLYKLDTSLITESAAITDIQMFIDFANKSNFVGTGEEVLIPNISGIIYVDNTSQLTATIAGVTQNVDEYYIRNTLQKQFPKMQFFFKDIDNQYTARFVLTDENNPRIEEEIGIQTVREGQFFQNPIAAYGDISEAKKNYDFFGWATDIEGKNIVASLESPEGWDALALGESKSYTYYAIFKVHSYKMRYYIGNELWHTESVIWKHPVTACPVTPYLDDSDLPFDETYKLLGYTMNRPIAPIDTDNEKLPSFIEFKNLIANDDYNFYACFKKDSVYNNILSESYLEDATPSLTYAALALKDGVNISGKITLPMKYKNKVVTSLAGGGFGNGVRNKGAITHVFFERTADGEQNPNITTIGNACFVPSTNALDRAALKYVEALDSIETIELDAFRYNYSAGSTKETISLQPLEFSNNSKLKVIGQAAFNACFGLNCTKTIIIPASVEFIEALAFNSQRTDNMSIQIGSFGHPSNLVSLAENAFNGAHLKDCTVYGYSNLPEDVKTVLQTAFGGNLHTID